MIMFLCEIILFKWKEVEKGDRNVLKLANMCNCLSLEVEDSYESLVHTKRHNFQRNLWVQGFYKLVLLKKIVPNLQSKIHTPHTWIMA